MAKTDRQAAGDYGAMGKYGREYEAFEIFEQIQNQERREETAPQPLSQGRIRELLSFEEAPYYEIEYDTEPVRDGGTIPGQGAISLPKTSGRRTESEETGDWSGSEADKGTWLLMETESEEAGGFPEAEKSKEAGSPAGAGEGRKSSAEAQNSAEAEERKRQNKEAEMWTVTGAQQLQPESIEPREEDPVRELFNRMRDIAREDRYLNFRSSRFFDQRMQQENARLFYRQGMFMKDFEDAYDSTFPFSSYYPNYQMMGYGQLRTFFTWRTAARQGRVEHVSLSYAFLYIYELLNNIGVDSPEEGMERFLFFWDAFRVYDRSLDKYAVRWLKDYYIYYGLPGTFRDFVEENGLGAYYPELSEEENSFELYCVLSKYDIRKSAFFTEREDLVRRCFQFIFERLQEAFREGGFDLDGLLFQPTRKMAAWVPFRGALFYPAGRQADRQVLMTRKEIYVCSRNQWTFSAVIATDSGKRLLGYIFKQMEAVLRKLTGYKHKLSANPDMLSPVMADELKKAGIILGVKITEAAEAFYKEETKTVVQVNPGALERIRREAYVIQEKLAVPEDEVPVAGQKKAVPEDEVPVAGQRKPETGGGDLTNGSEAVSAAPEAGDEWKALKEALTVTEMQALRIILNEKENLKQFADEHGVMLEVLAEGINEKASDMIGDGLLDNEFEVYGDYLEDVRRMMKVGAEV